MSVKLKTPRELRDEVLSLIQRDIEEMGHGQRAFESETAQDLCRYSNALLNIIKDQSNETEDGRKSLSKMTDEELAKKAEEALAAFKVKKP